MRRPIYAFTGGEPGSALVIVRTSIYGENSAVGTGACAAASRGAIGTTIDAATIAATRNNDELERDANMASPFAARTPPRRDLPARCVRRAPAPARREEVRRARLRV